MDVKIVVPEVKQRTQNREIKVGGIYLTDMRHISEYLTYGKLPPERGWYRQLVKAEVNGRIQYLFIDMFGQSRNCKTATELAADKDQVPDFYHLLENAEITVTISE